MVAAVLRTWQADVKADVLTAPRLGHAFDASLHVSQSGGYYHVHVV